MDHRMSRHYIAMVNDMRATVGSRVADEHGNVKYTTVPHPTYGQLVPFCAHGKVISTYDSPSKCKAIVRCATERLDKMIKNASGHTFSDVDYNTNKNPATWQRPCIKYFDTEDLATYGADQDTAFQEHESRMVRAAETAQQVRDGVSVDAPTKPKTKRLSRKNRKLVELAGAMTETIATRGVLSIRAHAYVGPGELVRESMGGVVPVGASSAESIGTVISTNLDDQGRLIATVRLRGS